ncbi:hypothetical protein [Halomicronema sp. CCY15110]|nr:hypothetical protein [Halomicronema sp. CCY15110]
MLAIAMPESGLVITLVPEAVYGDIIPAIARPQPAPPRPISLAS